MEQRQQFIPWNDAETKGIGMQLSTMMWEVYPSDPKRASWTDLVTESCMPVSAAGAAKLPTI